jgi:hypothetical protein
MGCASVPRQMRVYISRFYRYERETDGDRKERDAQALIDLVDIIIIHFRRPWRTSRLSHRGSRNATAQRK